MNADTVITHDDYDELTDELAALTDELNAIEIALNRAGMFRDRPDRTLAELVTQLAVQSPARQLSLLFDD